MSTSFHEVDQLFLCTAHENEKNKTFESLTRSAGVQRFVSTLDIIANCVNYDHFDHLYLSHDFYIPDNLYQHTGAISEMLMLTTTHTSMTGIGVEGPQDPLIQVESMKPESKNIAVNSGFFSKNMQHTLSTCNGISIQRQFVCNSFSELPEKISTGWCWSVYPADLGMEIPSEIQNREITFTNSIVVEAKRSVSDE